MSMYGVYYFYILRARKATPSAYVELEHLVNRLRESCDRDGAGYALAYQTAMKVEEERQAA